jgi:gliding motility-associated-like protein
MKKVILLFLLLFNATLVFAQTLPNDCSRAITVCGNETFFSNATGIGTVQEINGASCGGSESNSLWLKITIAPTVTPGSTLGFDLIPDDPSTNVDYDFYVFPANAVCGALGNAIRCCTTNPGPSPGGAALSNNITGINGSTLQTAVGPGPAASSSGDDYVRWLIVSPGQTYYIAIDRPVGNGGFQIQWTGTATAGAGAFAIPPTANSITNLKTCSNTVNVGIFDLNSARPLINPNTTSNTISFHTTISNAIDNIAPLPSIYVNTSNPQTIYARVTNNTSKCFSITSFNLVVNLVPNATMSVSNTQICNGDSVTVTYTGTPGATFDYTIAGGPLQTATFPASGIFTVIETLTTNTVYTLNGVRNLDSSGVIICNQPLSISRTVAINPLPTATIAGTTTLCSGSTTTITFSGTPDATVTYTVNGGINQTIPLDSSGTASVTTPALTATTTYALVSVTSSGTPVCSQTLTGSAVVSISLPTATISGPVSVCSGSTATITFSGTPDATVTYTVNGGINQTIPLDSSGTASVTTPALISTTTYTLVSVTTSGTPVCSQTLSGSAVVGISLPTATIAGTTTICSGATSTITFSGTPDATVTYTVNGGINQTIPLDSSGTASVITPALTATTTYALVSVTTSGTPVCSQTLSGSAVVSISLPTATIAGTTTICSGATTTITFSGTPDATVTYTVNGGINQTIPLDSSGTASVITPALTATTTYALVDVTTSGTLVCSQIVSGSAVVSISLPTATISGPVSVCSGSTATITFSGTPDATVTYTVNGGINQTIPLDSSGTASITTPALTATTSYALVDVTTSGTPVCSQTLSGSAVVGISLPTATIAGTTTICSGATTTITFSGTPDATVTYTVNGGINQTIPLDSSGTASVTTPALTSTTTYALVSVTTSGTPVCSQTLSGSAVVSISLPTATISGPVSVCSGTTSTITFSGTPDATVTYTVNGGINQTIPLDSSGTASVTTPALTATTTYALVSVTSSGTPVCSQTLTGSAVVSISLPTATISGPVSVCSGSTATITFSGTPDATVTYTVNGGINQTIPLDSSGTASVTTPALISTTTYTLVSVTTSGTPVCSQTLSGSAVVGISLPTATIAGTTTICSGATSTITFSGTPDATVTYTVNGGINQTIPLDSSGTASVTTPALTSTTTYALVSVTTSGTPVCSQTLSGSAVVSISLPTATIAGTTTICSGATTTITFSGTPDATVTYTVNGGINQTIPLDSSGTASVITPALTATTTYALVDVTTSGTLVCSQIVSGSAVVSISLPTATIAGTTTICSGATTTITFSGTPDATVTYTVNGGINQTIPLDSSGTASVTTPALTATTTTYALISVTSSGTPVCSQTLSGNAIVTVNTLPTATISGPVSVCSGSTATITFSGTPDATVTYNVNGGINQTIPLDSSGTASVTTPALTTTTTTYGLVSVTSSGTPVCSQIVSGSAIVTVNPLPTASISGTATICSGATATITFSGTPDATVTYTVNGGINQTIPLDSSGTASITTPALTATTTTYALVSVTSSGTPVCSQTLSGSAIITVNPLPTATISGATTICLGAIASITLSGIGGTAPYTFIYTINNIVQTPVISNSSGVYQLSVPTNVVGVFTYKLVSVQDSSASTCSQLQTGAVIVTINTAPIIAPPINFIGCDNYTNPFDGIVQLDLTQYENIILNGLDPLIYIISYYHNQSDAIAGTNAIPLAEAQAYISTPDSDQIWVKVKNSSNTTICYALTTINIAVERAPNPIIKTASDVNTICVDFTSNIVVRSLTLNSGITNPSAYTFQWFEDNSITPIPGATGPTYTVDTASPTGATRLYTVTVTSISTNACSTSSVAFPVIQSGQAELLAGTTGYTVTNAFSNNQTITVNIAEIVGYGTYEYSLDNGPRQTSNIFEGVSSGFHDIHIWDTEGLIALSCEKLSIEDILIIDYPRFFTPNGDGIHDTWNIVGLVGQPAATIYIFDRYGKLLKQISTEGQGWDGTYLGRLLPASDYWFSIDYTEQSQAKQFKAHFSLKR